MGTNVTPGFWFLISFLVSLCIGMELVSPDVEGPTTAPIGCHKRVYTYRVSQSDSKGNTCNDMIEVNACWGRCDSRDWKFPFKKSYHPVCIHSGRTKVSVMLRNCDQDAGIEAQKYDYTEPVSCSCQICTSQDTACESPYKHRGTTKKLIADLEDSLLEDDYSVGIEKS